jgi:hypothetical protein
MVLVQVGGRIWGTDTAAAEWVRRHASDFLPSAHQAISLNPDVPQRAFTTTNQNNCLNGFMLPAGKPEVSSISSIYQLCIQCNINLIKPNLEKRGEACDLAGSEQSAPAQLPQRKWQDMGSRAGA